MQRLTQKEGKRKNGNRIRHDTYSKMTTRELKESAEKGGYFTEIQEKLETEKEVSACIRWIMRGLSVDDAIHKVKVDAEVSANCLGR